jgi:hypothetical protein
MLSTSQGRANCDCRARLLIVSITEIYRSTSVCPRQISVLGLHTDNTIVGILPMTGAPGPRGATNIRWLGLQVCSARVGSPRSIIAAGSR